MQLAQQVRFIVENEVTGIVHLGAVDMVKECTFIEELAGKLTTGDINMQYNTYQDKDTTYYFGLVSNREDLPADLTITNKDIISYLVE